MAENQTQSFEEVNARVLAATNRRISVVEKDFTMATKPCRHTCAEHGEFTATPQNVYGTYKTCPQCSYQTSAYEIELGNALEAHGLTVERRIQVNGAEFDILVPDHGIAIEFNGVYWHSDAPQLSRAADAKFRHKKKTRAGQQHGYRVLHVWEDDWRYRAGVVLRAILHACGRSESSGARQYRVARIPFWKARELYDAYHLQGASGGGETFALINDAGEPVAAMTFSRRIGKRYASDAGEYELNRFASTHRVMGAASRLFKAFVRATPDAETIWSYADLSWFTGEMYERLGFVCDGFLDPDYRVVDKIHRRHKSGYQLKHLRARFGEEACAGKTEREICHENGLWRIYDAGKARYLWQRP